MIRSLRQRHRVVSFLMLLLLPPLAWLGIASREPIPGMSFPGTKGSGTPYDRALESGMAMIHANNNLWGELALTTFLFEGNGKLLLLLFPDQALEHPDVLLYWQAAPVVSANELASNAKLLGRLPAPGGGRYELDKGWLHEKGKLVLYSLAHRQVLASADFPFKARSVEESR